MNGRLSTPEERIAAAIWAPEDPEFRDTCNRIHLHVELELERRSLEDYQRLATQDAYKEGRALYLRDLIQKKQEAVRQIETRINFVEAAKKNAKP